MNQFRPTIIAIILLAIIYIFGISIGLVIWDYISIPFTNHRNAVGPLTLANYNPTNNSARWGIMIILPSLLFLISQKIPLISSICTQFLEKLRPTDQSNTSKLINHITLFIIVSSALLPIFIFIQKDFSTKYFDVFHEGVELTPAFNYLNHKGIWTGNLLIRGAYNDLFTAYLGWKIFDNISIGSYRLIRDFSLHLIPIGFGLFLYSIYSIFKNKLNSSLIVNLILFIYLITGSWQNFERRAFLLLISLAIAIGILNHNSMFLIFLLGFMSSFSIFFSLDTGIFVNAIIFISMIIMMIKFRKSKAIISKKFGALIFGVFTSWLIFYSYFGVREFSAFIQNFVFLFTSKDLLDGLVHTKPNIIISYRESIPVYITAFNLLFFTIFYRTVYKKSDNKNIIYLHFLLIFISILYYKSALGRSDLFHIEYSSSLIYISFAFNVGLAIISIFSKRSVTNYLTIVLILINLVLIFANPKNTFNLQNLLTLNSRIVKYSGLRDYAFYNKDRIDGIKQMQEIFVTESCIYSLTSDAIAPYMLKKPSCNKFYITYIASIDPQRKEMLTSLQETHPRYILYESKLWTQNLDGINNEMRYPELMDYINSNYHKSHQIAEYWTIYSLNQSDSEINQQ